MKRAQSFLTAFILLLGVFCVPFFGVVDVSAQNEVLNYRTDFLWGQNLHNSNGYNSPDSNSEDRVYYAVKQGVKLIRYQGNDITEDFTETDKIVGLCNKYGVKVMLLLKTTRPDEPTQDDLDYIRNYTKTFADRYNGKNGRGKVDYFQLYNEQQNGLRKAKYGDAGAVDGSSKGHYYDISVAGKQDLVEWTKYFKAAIQGVKEADTDAKALVNFSRTAWGDILYYVEHGVEFDGLAWNFYPDSLDPEKAKKQFYEAMYGAEDEETGKHVYGLRELFPDKEVIITESNTAIKRITDYSNIEKVVSVNDNWREYAAEYDAFVEVMKLAYQQDWIKGLCAFQITNMTSHTQEEERHYGHIAVDKVGEFIGTKPIYYLYQSLIGGTDSVEKIAKSSIDITPYDIFKVKTQSDSGFNIGSVDADDDFVDFDSSYIESSDFLDDVDLDEAEDDIPIEPENVYQRTTSTVTTSKMPWLLIALVGAGMLVLFSAGFTTLLIIKKKRLKPTQ